jgi:hypothetical protein
VAEAAEVHRLTVSLYKIVYRAEKAKERRSAKMVFVVFWFFRMFAPELIAALQAFVATLAFVTVCLGLTKTLVDAGFLKKLNRDV